jgi:predicted metal-dependent hydrolase
MGTTLKLGSLTVDVVKKDIKNVHLGVYPPEGKVRISAPLRMSSENIRLFAISKLQWIRLQQGKIEPRFVHLREIAGNVERCGLLIFVIRQLVSLCSIA